MSGKRDDLFAKYSDDVADFVFDKHVVAVFDDMIRRSVPGYATVVAMTRVFAQHYAQADSYCYDLGCSLGASTLAMRGGITAKNCTIRAVDSSAEMIGRCREIAAGDISTVPVEFVCDDMMNVPIERASVVVMNYTLQFLAPGQREEMIGRIYDGLLPGGVLVLAEKVVFDCEKRQEFERQMHEDFKRLNGYSELEISQKRKSLENTLIPDTESGHIERLERAGFAWVEEWFRCFNFMAMAAFKR